MAEKLLSVGLDVGTTTTQMVLSQLWVENEASSFAVPKLQITDRKILYRSPVCFTPLLGKDRVDGEKIRALIEGFYRQAGITKAQVDTGAVIITGETSRKENAAAVLQALSGFAGDFVAATAGPELESVLAAKGAGATAWSKESGKTVLHMDIGGGTSNLALCAEGNIVRTGCLNVGGRLLKFEQGRVAYVSPVLEGLTDLRPGDYPSPGQTEAIVQVLVQALEMAAGLQEPTPLLEKLWTKECGAVWEFPPGDCMISFSGGVADCIENSGGDFGDIGHLLGKAIKNSLLCRDRYRLGAETIRATVIGAGCHSAQLSGSTVFCKNVTLPLKNLPVQILSPQGDIRITERSVLAFSGLKDPTYAQVAALGERLLKTGAEELYVCLEGDAAKALGQYLTLHGLKHCLCIDGIQPTPESYLDIGMPIGSAYPVVVKTLILENGQQDFCN